MNHNLKLSNEGYFKIENNIRNYRHFSNSFMKGKLKLTREVQLNTDCLYKLFCNVIKEIYIKQKITTKKKKASNTICCCPIPQYL